MKISNKTILITGGTSGIGYILGKELLVKKNTVILLGRNGDRLKALEKEGFETIACDLGRQDDVEEAVLEIENQFPGLEILFNNAGVQYNYLITDTVIPLTKIRDEIEINLTGQIILTQLLIPVLARNSDSMIVNTTSGLGAFPKSDGLVYSASKAGMRSFTTGLKYALKDTNISVAEFIPPVTDTNMTAGRSENKMSPEKLVQTILPQLERGKSIVTTSQIRIFLWISFLFPGLANKILSK
ncbi:MAG: SDR family NAD(P)-dependent oxidoreductase [Saprospiraceae bacterium]|nr:SDR family NAD(P)-dependent oxidoreductase [Saprospiraceae bacterium]